MKPQLPSLAVCLALVAALPAHAEGGGTEQYAAEATVSVLTDRRTHGISDSYLRPAAELHVELAHASGLVGVFELGTVAHEVFLNSNGYNALFAGGYRWGDPDGWHFGLGAAHEIFPGAHADLPTSMTLAIDPNTGQPTVVPGDFKDFRFDSSYGIVEFAYGALEARYMNVLSRDFRGMNTGLICGTLLVGLADPTPALDCYARGDHGSRGTHLLDVDWHHALLDGQLTLLVHGGVQKVRNFPEADGWDWRIGVERGEWGLKWKLEAVGTQLKQPATYTAADDNGHIRQLGKTGLVLTVSKTFE